MINLFEVAETNKMIEQENLDVRTLSLIHICSKGGKVRVLVPPQISVILREAII